MDVHIFTENRFVQYQGKIYTIYTNDDYFFWKRYLSSFRQVTVIARVSQTDVQPEFQRLVEGPGVTVLPLTYYHGLIQALLNLGKLLTETRVIVKKQKSSFILRVPGIIGSCAYLWLWLYNIPFALEIVSDPYDCLSPAVIKSWWARVIQPLATLGLKTQAKNAVAVAYVTETQLQKRYPAKQGGHTTHYSSLQLSELYFNAFLQRKKTYPPAPNDKWNFIFIGSLWNHRKGLDSLLHALHLIKNYQIQFNLFVLGDGQYLEDYKLLANSLGLNTEVHFLGFVSKTEDVINYLSQADLFILPSLGEGLPRAMLEAMACGVPCIGSAVSGIPELLPDKFIFPPHNPQNLADKILEIISKPLLLQEASQANHAIAQTYKEDVLNQRRNAFYDYIYKISSAYFENNLATI